MSSMNTSNANNIFPSSLKPNYKSTPIIKNSHMNLNEDTLLNKNVIFKESFNSNNKILDNKNIMIDTNTYTFTSPNKRLTPMSSTHNQATKNPYVNLWRKPVFVGGGTQTPVNSDKNNKLNKLKGSLNLNVNSNLKSPTMTSKNHSNLLITTNTTNTNYTDTKQGQYKEFMNEYTTNKCTSPVNIEPKKDSIKVTVSKQILSNANKILKKVEINQNNYMTNYNTNINISNSDNFQSDILSSILNFKSLLKSNELANNLDKMFKSEENVNKIQDLNSKLNRYGGSIVNNCYSSNPNFYVSNERRISGGSNKENSVSIIKRDSMLEQVDPSKKKQINVINANMLGDHVNLNPRQNSEERERKHITTTPNPNPIPITLAKPEIMNEIAINSDLRLRRYEILLDFINTNLKEINQMMSSSNSIIKPNNNNNINSNNLAADISKDLNKIDEVNSNKLSSLHSRINLNSNMNIDKDLYDYEDSLMNDRINMLGRIGGGDESNVFLNFYNNDKENLLNTMNKELSQKKGEPCHSFFVSSINSDFYQHLLEESYSNLPMNNFPNDLSSFRTPNEQARKLERMVSYESDKTPLQYISRYSNKLLKNSNNLHEKNPNANIIPNLKDKASVLHSNAQDNFSLQSDTVVYYENEENVEEIDLDRTKEHIHNLDPKKLTYNQVIKDIERVKFFSHNPKIKNGGEENIEVKEEYKTETSPKNIEDKSSKCTIY